MGLLCPPRLALPIPGRPCGHESPQPLSGTRQRADTGGPCPPRRTLGCFPREGALRAPPAALAPAVQDGGGESPLPLLAPSWPPALPAFSLGRGLRAPSGFPPHGARTHTHTCSPMSTQEPRAVQQPGAQAGGQLE